MSNLKTSVTQEAEYAKANMGKMLGAAVGIASGVVYAMSGNKSNWAIGGFAVAGGVIGSIVGAMFDHEKETQEAASNVAGSLARRQLLWDAKAVQRTEPSGKTEMVYNASGCPDEMNPCHWKGKNVGCMSNKNCTQLNRKFGVRVPVNKMAGMRTFVRSVDVNPLMGSQARQMFQTGRPNAIEDIFGETKIV